VGWGVGGHGLGLLVPGLSYGLLVFGSVHTPESSLPGNYANAACGSSLSAVYCARCSRLLSSGDLNAIAEVERY